MASSQSMPCGSGVDSKIIHNEILLVDNHSSDKDNESQKNTKNEAE